jgi:uncharacterized protein
VLCPLTFQLMKTVAAPLFSSLLLLAFCSPAGGSPADATPPRSPDTFRRLGNHLKDQSSLYLQQHAHNPIDWHPWGDEALGRARREDKPIFLSIGYSSCHWCHVMEHEVFEDDQVAEYLNRHFICIKVDREERPDLDAVYMQAVQMMTGRGGWPLSSFLTPELTPFFGGTYFPRDQFMELIERVQVVFTSRRDELEEQGARIAANLGRDLAGDDLHGEIGAEMIEAAARSAVDSYDSLHAGFGTGMKFPTPVKWSFLLHQYRKTGDPELGRMVQETCQAMAGGGIYDHVGGGFHRYTVDRDWTVPHFEKMLYDNAQLTSLFLEAGEVFQRQDFTAVGLDVLEFLIREMRDPDGGFYGSFDADSGGEEGSYYVWNRQQILAVTGVADGEPLADLLGVSPRGNFENSGSSVLTRRGDEEAIAWHHDLNQGELTKLLPAYRDQLRRERALRTPPGLDPKVITAWNGLTISALAHGYSVSGEGRYLDAARDCADFILSRHHREDGTLWRSSNGGEPAGDGILDDYAFLANGLIDLYQISGDEKYLIDAEELLSYLRREFTRERGAFFLTGQGTDIPLGRHFEFYDGAEPSGNGIALQALLRFAALTGRQEYLDEMKGALDRSRGLLQKTGLECAAWFDAALRLNGPFYDIVIAGSRGAPLMEELHRAALDNLSPWTVLSQIPADGAGETLLNLSPVLLGKSADAGGATAYVCQFGTCQAPTSDPARVRKQVARGWIK